MITALEILLKIAGVGLLLLAFLHIPIGQKLRWREDARKLSPENEQIFHVHTFFICLTVTLMALPCLISPSVFLVKSEAGLWATGSLALFWVVRLFFQFFIYRSDLWKGKRLETMIHRIFSLIWLILSLLFSACCLLQCGWIR